MSLEGPDEDSPLAGRAGEGALRQEDGEDEQMPDWTQFAAFAKSLQKKSNVAFIPSRGEKDYAPTEILASQQATDLERSRAALYEALELGGVRQHSSRQHNRAVWHPDIARAALDDKHMSSVHYRTMGRYHSGRKRTELLPEEALYLVERGTLECWTEEGVPMSAQHAFTAMLNREGLTAEHYQIYAYLRRLGYAVLRADLESMLPPRKVSPLVGGPRLDPFALLKTALSSAYTAFLVRLKAFAMLLPRVLGLGADLYLAVHCGGLGIFAALQIIPAGHDVPLAPETPLQLPVPEPAEPYRVFFHVYKPITKFKKTEPPPPDFYLAVVNARTTPLFTLDKVTALLQSIPLPAEPPAPPRPGYIALLRQRLPIWLGGLRPPKRPPRPPNPFPRLKGGRRNVVLAIVDSGTSTFLRLAEGELGTLPLLGGS